MTNADLTAPRGGGADRRAFVLSALAAIFWGSNFEATRIVLEGSPPLSAAAGRFALAAVVTLLWMRLSVGPGLGALRRNLAAFALLGLIGIAAFNAALFLGMRSASPVTGALIMGTSPLTTTLMEALLLRRRPAPRMLLGMAISLCGIALTVGAFSGAVLTGGDLIILAGSLCWALYTVGCRHWVHEATPLETTAWTMLSGTAALGLAAWIFEAPLTTFASAAPAVWGATLWMALAGSTAAFAFWQTGIRQRGPGPTSVLFNLVPVSALLIAMGFGRMPALSQWAGVALAIGGVLLASGAWPRLRR
ncbi:DMT family transporter [Salipiger sp. P9]|uniref:DMT family transporter n=1 Tax=Salipiger pentaromativorans TaxID=2943193 RepID=UPI002157C6FE|nr:DMT family transporter [Salipiger pentaromativorans]MCR8547291.1 DMT family transporter [Salipiger pentaromativorans]